MRDDKAFRKRMRGKWNLLRIVQRGYIDPNHVRRLEDLLLNSYAGL